MNEGRDEEMIARVLRAAGRPELPAGLEARVLARLAEPEAARTRGGWVWPVVAAGVAVAVVAGGLGWIEQDGRRGAEMRDVLTTTRPVEMGSTVAGRNAAAEEPSGSMGANVDARSRPVRSTARRAVLMEGAAARPDTRGSVAAAETDSFPAPPLPLTRQERLLLRMLRGGEGTELVATLSAGAERAAEMNERTERREFFRRPEPVDDASSDGANGQKRPVSTTETEKVPAEEHAVSTAQATDSKQER